MAQKLGPFARFEANREPMLRVIRNHRRAAYAADPSEYEGLTVKPVTHAPTLFTQETWALARKMWDDALSIGEVAGYRNAQVTVTAPTGTIGLVMDCDTTGIEPDFALGKVQEARRRRLLQDRQSIGRRRTAQSWLLAGADRCNRDVRKRHRNARRVLRTSIVRR